VPRAVLFDLEPGVIGAITLRRRSANSSAWENLVNENAGADSNVAELMAENGFF
jgi:hypothetical protein